jgi:hypothetical protein
MQACHALKHGPSITVSLQDLRYLFLSTVTRLCAGQPGLHSGRGSDFLFLPSHQTSLGAHLASHAICTGESLLSDSVAAV